MRHHQSLFRSNAYLFIDFYARYKDAGSSYLTVEDDGLVVSQGPWYLEHWELFVDAFLALAIISGIFFIIVSYQIHRNKNSE